MRPMIHTLVLFGLALTACGGTGDVQVFIAAEDSIPEGIQAGVEDENIRDGWSVSYSKFLVTVGNFRAARSSGGSAPLNSSRKVVLDLVRLPTSGFILTEFNDVAAVRWDRVGFDLPNTTAQAVRPDITPQADYDFMVQNGYSLYFEATLTNPSGQSCRRGDPTQCVPQNEIQVAWGLRAGTSFDGCAPEQGDSGFAVPTGGTVQVKPTIHGDHWFFNNFTQDTEQTTRYAQWVADSDLDQNGVTTLEELRAVLASQVLPSPRYNLSGAIIDVETAYDFLEAQARTLGDFQGGGECPERRVL